MKKNILITVVLVILLISCDLNKSEKIGMNPDIIFSGSAGYFQYDYEYPALNGKLAIEQSIFRVGGNQICIYTDLEENGLTFISESIDSRNFITKDIVDIESSTFFYIDYINSKYYCAYANRMDSGIYLMESIDGVTWEFLNNGNALIKPSLDENSIWSIIWNPSFVIDEDNIMHLYIECAPQCVSQSDVGLGYAEINLNDLSVYKYDKHILKGGGNPWIKKIEDVYLLVTGISINGFWGIEAFKTSDFYNLTKLDFSISEDNIHICDPNLTETTDGKLLISYSYDQRYTFFNYAEIEYKDILSEKIFYPRSMKEGKR